MKQETAESRCQYLSNKTGLVVTSYPMKGVEYFQFRQTKRTIMTVPTYRKARCFAQGFALGRLA